MSSSISNLLVVGAFGAVMMSSYAALEMVDVAEALAPAAAAVESTEGAMTEAQAYAEKKGLSYTFGGRDTTYDPILKAFMRGNPSFDNMQLVEAETRLTLEGRETTEVYTTDIHARSHRYLGRTMEQVYANECTVSGDDVTGRIVYRDVTNPQSEFIASKSNNTQHMAVASQMNCALMLENGIFAAFKEEALARIDQ